MDLILKELVNRLPHPDIELTESNIKKIHRLIPVPNDYRILWADIMSFGGYPAGVVITEQALIIKSTKEEVKKSNAKIKEQNNGIEKSKRAKPLKDIYQIIPWEYYSPDGYEVLIKKDKKGNNKYIFRAGNSDLIEFKNPALYNLFNSYNTAILEEQKRAEEIIENSTIASVNSISVEGTMFNAAYGADQTRTGHGVYAEEAGAILDILSGEKSTVVGRDNAKNGPDKIVNTIPVQCKYCKTPYATVNSCFKTNAEGSKVFRYYDLNGNPMKIEVPSDQYSQAIEYLKRRINAGQVPGVKDPDAAYDIIRKGKLSYKQTLNLAKAGTIDSLVYDAATGAVTCLSAFGVSSIVTFAQVYWCTKDYRKAAKYAVYTGLQVYGLTFAGGIIASQIARTGVANSFSPVAKNIVNNMNPKTVQEIINAFRTLAGKKAIYGAAAQKSFAKFLGSNAITEGVLFFAFSSPDIYRVCNGKISGAQYVKNMLSLVASFAGSTSTTVATGAILGKIAGGTFNKTVGATIGFAAGAAGGFISGNAAKAMGNIFHEDDSVITTRMFNAILVNLLIEYMLSDSEQNLLINLLNDDEDALRKLQQGILKSTSQSKDIEDYLRPKFERIVKHRTRITEIEENHFYENMNSLILNGGLEYGM